MSRLRRWIRGVLDSLVWIAESAWQWLTEPKER